MSSIISTKKYKIVLFQGGLADDGSGFDETINLLKNASTDFLKYPLKIDMSNFNSEQGCFYSNASGYYTKSSQALNDFKILIANIVTYAQENE